MNYNFFLEKVCVIGWKDLLVLMPGGTGGDCISRSKRLVRICTQYC